MTDWAEQQAGIRTVLRAGGGYITYLRMEPSDERLVAFLLVDHGSFKWVRADEIPHSASVEETDDVINGLSMAAIDPSGRFVPETAPSSMGLWLTSL